MGARLVLASFFLLACDPDPWLTAPLAEVAAEHADVRFEALGRYSRFELEQIVGLAGTSERVAITNGIVMYRVIYPTHTFDGERVQVSGLLAIPSEGRIKGIVSWQHGTNTYRPGSISAPSVDEGIGLSAAMAGNGYLFVAADYIGLGVSEEPHPYYYVPSTTRAVIDLLPIAEAVLAALGRADQQRLYLAGFSQGGGASAATHRELERSNPTSLELRATAAVSGAFNLRDISLHEALASYDEPGSNSPIYLGYVLNAYAHVYAQPLDEIVRSPYDDQLAEWFDGEHNGRTLRAMIPASREDFFIGEFLDDFEAEIDEPRWFYDALAENETFDWSPRAPLRFYYGTADRDVAPRESLSAYAHMSALGGNVSIVDVGAADHGESILLAIPNIQRWFDELSR